jgi:hypothetical protein
MSEHEYNQIATWLIDLTQEFQAFGKGAIELVKAQCGTFQLIFTWD